MFPCVRHQYDQTLSVRLCPIVGLKEELLSAGFPDSNAAGFCLDSYGRRGVKPIVTDLLIGHFTETWVTE